MFNKIIHSFIIFLLSGVLFAQVHSDSDVKGLFLNVGVGPRIPIGNFNVEQALGVGFDAGVSYANTDSYPFFYYALLSYNNFSGDYDYYNISDYSSLTTNLLGLDVGAKYYFSPIIEDEILLMPFLHGGFSYSFVTRSNQFKVDSGIENFIENYSKYGFHVGGGLSIFLMEIVANYRFLQHHQTVSFDVRMTIPLAITL